MLAEYSKNSPAMLLLCGNKFSFNAKFNMVESPEFRSNSGRDKTVKLVKCVITNEVTSCLVLSCLVAKSANVLWAIKIWKG